MAADFPRGSFLEGFAEYLQEQKSNIGQRWMTLARESPDIPTAVKISTEALEDHVPELLDDLIRRLQKEGEIQEETSRHSRHHGQTQWQAGYSISELVWELYIIRRVLTQETLARFVEEHPEHLSEDCRGAETLIHDFFHRLTCDSASQFADEQQRLQQQKNDALHEVNESRIQLTRTVSHELRNILNALSLANQELEEEGNLEQRREISRRCQRNLGDMSQVLNQLLDYSTLVAGRSQLDLQRISAPKLLEEIVLDWKPVAEENGLRFEHKCDPGLGELTTDKLKLRQVVGNLLSNAIKYRKREDGGYVGVSFTSQQENKWGITVADTGRGIAAEHMGLLFGEFNRINPDSETNGSGLGLAICKQYVELLGGTIRALSREGEGTRFEITLPFLTSDE